MAGDVVFETTALANRIKNAEEKTLAIYKENECFSEAQELLAQLDAAAREDSIRVVFIGQYTAGKSTVISALTSNKDIKIDSDIATSIASDHSWNGITLTDTPGLYTENPEHDAETINTIRKSDLLVYCITSDLFNPYTLKDFEKWAFDDGFSGKMFLLVNKMSKEAGDYEVLVERYSETIDRSLIPHSVNELSHSFVDAKDYKDGVEDSDDDLIEYSHFEDFIESLNVFVKQKGLLGKLDKPVMILKASIDKMSERIGSDATNKAFNALLTRVEKKVDQQRIQMSVDAGSIIRQGLRPIADKGYELSRLIGIEDVNFTEDDIYALVESSCEKINQQLASLCEETLEHLNEEIEVVLNSPTADYFFKSVSANYDGKKRLFESKEAKFTRSQFEAVQGIVERITNKTIECAVKGGGDSAKFFIRSAEASGSHVHKAILAVGGKMGYKFKPWEAAKIAKNIGNAAKIAGPVLSAIGFLFDVKETVDEQKQAQEVAKAQIKYRQNFLDIVSDLEQQYAVELKEMYAIFGDVCADLQQRREKIQSLLDSNDSMNARLLEVRSELNSIQAEIF